MIYNMCLSKNCPVNSPNELKYEYSLNDIAEFLEMIDIGEALEIASVLDEESKNKQPPGR